MNRGRGSAGRSYSSPSGRSSPSSAGHYPHRNRHITNEVGSYSDGYYGSRGGFSRGRRGNASLDSFHSYSNPGPKMAWKPKDESSNVERFQHSQNASNARLAESKQRDSSESFAHSLDGTEEDVRKGDALLHCDFAAKVNASPLQTESQLSQEQCAKSVGSPGEPVIADSPETNYTFDICLSKTRGVPSLNPPLHTINRQRRNNAKHASEGHGQILEQGMVLLKGFLSLEDQVRIVKQCRLIGKGPGGFYQPGYRDGAKLQLRMMCLGKNWDPNTSQYGDRRPVDGAEPPIIPAELHQFVEHAMKSCHALVATNSRGSNAEKTIPSMSPDICIVNFYTASGRLGLHQDKDESEESLKRELPVVSFSIGDTGEFLYGNSRDEKDAKLVLLESGDVLIFGGKSRHIFHGVRSIISDTAPKLLLQETNLRRGRLNLTFRQY